MSALAAEVEAVEAEDMEVGLDYWLPGDVKLQQNGLFWPNVWIGLGKIYSYLDTLGKP